MGFLDHSTNNIILDAVLTDYGRRKLAAGGGGNTTSGGQQVSSFIISQYALGDDEVDYHIVERYGRAVGKEKIEKNTPIFEALTNQDVALKYKLISRESDPVSFKTTRLPTLELATPTTNLVIGETASFTDVTLNLKLGNSLSFASNTSLLQGSYVIKISGRFFTIGSDGKITARTSTFDPGNPNQVTEYLYNAGNSNNSESIKFRVNKKVLDNTMLSVYGKRVSGADSNVRQIDSTITVTGRKTGVSLTFPISIRQTRTS